jgi:hypothetical protein
MIGFLAQTVTYLGYIDQGRSGIRQALSEARRLDHAFTRAFNLFPSSNQRTTFSILYDAGPAGLSLKRWNEKARAIGLGKDRPATLVGLRKALKNKGLVTETANGWAVKQQ